VSAIAELVRRVSNRIENKTSYGIEEEMRMAAEPENEKKY